jgi:hypothetical protein
MWRNEEGQCGNEGLRLGEYDMMEKPMVLHEVEMRENEQDNVEIIRYDVETRRETM